MISLHLVEQVIASSIYLTTPILLAGIGGLVNRQAGIVNIALEAKMMVGAFVAIVVSSATGGWFLAVIFRPSSVPFVIVESRDVDIAD